MADKSRQPAGSSGFGHGGEEGTGTSFTGDILDLLEYDQEFDATALLSPGHEDLDSSGLREDMSILELGDRRPPAAVHFEFVNGE